MYYWVGLMQQVHPVLLDQVLALAGSMVEQLEVRGMEQKIEPAFHYHHFEIINLTSELINRLLRG